MSTPKVTECVLKYVNDEFAKINTKCKMTVELMHGGEPWMADPNVNLKSGDGGPTELTVYETTAAL
jgi:hypothetical protein